MLFDIPQTLVILTPAPRRSRPDDGTVRCNVPRRALR